MPRCHLALVEFRRPRRLGHTLAESSGAQLPVRLDGQSELSWAPERPLAWRLQERLSEAMPSARPVIALRAALLLAETGIRRGRTLATLPKKALRFVSVAVALLAFAVFFRFVAVRLWPKASVALMLISLVGIVALLAIPLVFPGLGFYRSNSLKKVNEAMAREESESGGSH